MTKKIRGPLLNTTDGIPLTPGLRVWFQLQPGTLRSGADPRPGYPAPYTVALDNGIEVVADPSMLSGKDPRPEHRARAASFGKAAAAYDRYRPNYPPALFDALLARAPTQVLDIGCGTGKLALPLQQRGLSVLGLEPDPKMAKVARHHGLIVEVSSFESFDPAGHTFDLLTCGAAWHWLDPNLRAQKAASLLRPEGTLALVYNSEVPAEPYLSALTTLLADQAPTLTQFVPERRPGATFPLPEELFEIEPPTTFPWQRTLTTAEWVAMVTTFSAYQITPQAQLQAFLQILTKTLDDFGGVIHTEGGAFTQLARRR